MEKDPQPLPGSRAPIEPQKSDVRIFKDALPTPMPPVFGTAQPPAGLSGLIRRFAYRYPDNKPRRWLMLMLADRVDVLEHSLLRRSLPVGAGLAALLLVGGLSFKLLRR
jgi:hypothetical protein